MSNEKEKEIENGVNGVNEEDDFDFSSPKDGEAGDGGEAGKEGEIAAEDKKGEGDGDGASATGEDGKAEEAAKGDEEDPGGKGEGDKGAEGGAGDGAEKSGDGTSEDDKAGEAGDGEGAAATGEGEKDFFAGDFPEVEGDQTKPVDIKSLATAFEVEAETPQELQTKINEKIENAKQDVKLDGYTADAQSIIKHLNENGGEVEDFFNNKEIASLQGIVGMEPEAKVLYVRTSELTRSGLDHEQATEQAKGEIENLGTREIKDAAAKIDSDAGGLIKTEVQNIIGDREKVVSQDRQKIETKTKAEIETLKNYVKTQDDFMGIQLTPKAKAGIVREIESGAFDSIANKSPETSKFAAYMFAKFGTKILENINKEASEQNRKGHNAATDKATGALHKTKAAAQTKKTGKQAQESGDTKNFDSWADDDLFKEEAE